MRPFWSRAEVLTALVLLEKDYTTWAYYFVMRDDEAIRGIWVKELRLAREIKKDAYQAQFELSWALLRAYWLRQALLVIHFEKGR